MTTYSVHPMADGRGEENGSYAVVNDETGAVRCECGSEDEALTLAAELNGQDEGWPGE